LNSIFPPQITLVNMAS